jgi:hypothetical protein
MMHPSVCFPDYHELAGPSQRSADPPKALPSSAGPDHPRRDFQRMVLPSGCVLFLLNPPQNQPQSCPFQRENGRVVRILSRTGLL